MPPPGAKAGNKVSAELKDFAVDLVDGTVSQAGKEPSWVIMDHTMA